MSWTRLAEKKSWKSDDFIEPVVKSTHLHLPLAGSVSSATLGDSRTPLNSHRNTMENYSVKTPTQTIPQSSFDSLSHLSFLHRGCHCIGVSTTTILSIQRVLALSANGWPQNLSMASRNSQAWAAGEPLAAMVTAPSTKSVPYDQPIKAEHRNLLKPHLC